MLFEILDDFQHIVIYIHRLAAVNNTFVGNDRAGYQRGADASFIQESHFFGKLQCDYFAVRGVLL